MGQESGSRAKRKAHKRQARREKRQAKLADRLGAYRDGVAREITSALEAGEQLVAAVPAQLAGQRHSSGGGLTSVLSNTVDARGNRERAAAAASSAEAIGLPPDIDAVVLAATDRRLLVFRKPRSSKLPKGFPRLGVVYYPPGDLAAALPYGHLVAVRAREVSVDGNRSTSGLIELVTANGASHVMASWVEPAVHNDQHGPLLEFATTVTQLASQTAG